jgi:hypothetical protein
MITPMSISTFSNYVHPFSHPLKCLQALVNLCRRVGCRNLHNFYCKICGFTFNLTNLNPDSGLSLWHHRIGEANDEYA